MIIIIITTETDFNIKLIAYILTFEYMANYTNLRLRYTN